MEQFVYATSRLPGLQLDYNAKLGCRVTDFLSNVTDLAGSGDPLSPWKGQVDHAAQRCGRRVDLPRCSDRSGSPTTSTA